MKKILILPLLLFFLIQGSMAQTPKWVEKAKRAVFSTHLGVCAMLPCIRKKSSKGRIKIFFISIIISLFHSFVN